MKIRSLILLATFIVFISKARGQYVNIPDANFRTYLSTNFPGCMSGNSLDTTCAAVVNATWLEMIGLQISDIDGVQYFDNLDSLVCSANSLTALPPLPSTLRYLDASVNQLNTMPALPASLQILQCNNNQLSALPALPAGLIVLTCSYNSLGILPLLPQGLVQLDCSFNPLGTLPSMPPGLLVLRANFNSLAALPSLPAQLTELRCMYNQIASLPELPSGLQQLYLVSNPITCLPALPSTLTYLDVANTSVTCLPNRPATQTFVINPPKPNCTAGNPNNCSYFPYSYISGTLFSDLNTNGNMEPGEFPITNAAVSIHPGNYTAYSDVNGFFIAGVDTGNYAISVNYPYYSTTTIHSASINDFNQIDSLNNFPMVAVANNITDLRVQLVPTTLTRSGFSMGQRLLLANVGTSVVNGTAKVAHNTNFIYQGASITPLSYSNDTITFSYSNLVPGATQFIDIQYMVPVGMQIATWHTSSAVGYTVSPDSVPANNTDLLDQEIWGPFDPNVKQVYPGGDITPAQVSAGDPLHYTIHFQNTGNDTAFTVVLKDTLSQHLDIFSFNLMSASHPCSWNIDAQGILTFVFNNIELPDSNINEPASHGFVEYRISPISSFSFGDSITNTAHIFFDFNSPIATNNVVTSLDITSSVVKHDYAKDISIFPNPSAGCISLGYTLKEGGNAVIRVMDVTGKIIHEDQKKLSPGKITHELNVAAAEGLYLLMVILPGETYTSRLIIQQ